MYAIGYKAEDGTCKVIDACGKPTIKKRKAYLHPNYRSAVEFANFFVPIEHNLRYVIYEVQCFWTVKVYSGNSSYYLHPDGKLRRGEAEIAYQPRLCCIAKKLHVRPRQIRITYRYNIPL